MPESEAPIMIVAGTRPEAIKLAPIIEWLNILDLDYVFIWSGQHYDFEMSKIFFEQLGLPKPDKDLDIKSGTHAEQVATMTLKLERIIDIHKPSVVVAQGDTNTVVASALTAAKKLIPFAHVEAGLRSWDRTMPEEINRVIADAVAELHFAPTTLAAINLMHEGVPLKKIHITGNTIVDIVYKYMDRATRTGKELLDELGLERGGYILVTIHRQENTDSPQRLRNIVKALVEISERYTIVFPIHPRTINKLKEYNLWKNLVSQKNIHVLKPLGYFQFLGLLMNTLLVLTDSGGLQEEACILRIPTLTLRYNTERPETVLLGINKVIGVEAKNIIRETFRAVKIRDELIKKTRELENPFGDGRAGERIAKILKVAVDNGLQVEAVDTREDPYITYSLIKLSDIKKLSNKYYDIVALYDDKGIPVTDISEAREFLIRAAISKLLKAWNRNSL